MTTFQNPLENHQGHHASSKGEVSWVLIPSFPLRWDPLSKHLAFAGVKEVFYSPAKAASAAERAGLPISSQKERMTRWVDIRTSPGPWPPPVPQDHPAHRCLSKAQHCEMLRAKAVSLILLLCSMGLPGHKGMKLSSSWIKDLNTK